MRKENQESMESRKQGRNMIHWSVLWLVTEMGTENSLPLECQLA